MTIRCGFFYTCKLFKKVFEVSLFFWGGGGGLGLGAYFRHVLAETTTGRFLKKKAIQTFGEEKKGEE